LYLSGPFSFPKSALAAKKTEVHSKPITIRVLVWFMATAVRRVEEVEWVGEEEEGVAEELVGRFRPR